MKLRHAKNIMKKDLMDNIQDKVDQMHFLSLKTKGL